MNDELRHLFEEDQADREAMRGDTSPDAWERVSQRDGVRLARCKELIAAGALQTGKDYFYAALLHHHTGNLGDVWQAHELARRADQLGHRTNLAAGTYDRWLLMQGKPQKYGTQYQGDGTLYPIDPATTDEERAEYLVPPLARLQADAARRRSDGNE